ncbi:MAG: reverse transcriptase domain-containing protein [Cetobacterium sp.]
MGVRILNYLDDWLVLAHSEAELISHRSIILNHLECLGLRVNFPKSSLSPSQRVSFLGIILDSTHTRAVVTPEQSLAIQSLMPSLQSN